MNDEETFGAVLKRLREAAGLSQKELAERVKVYQRTVSLWELGKREPLLTNIRAIAAALGVDCNTICAPPGPAPGVPTRGRPSLRTTAEAAPKANKPGPRKRKGQ